MKDPNWCDIALEQKVTELISTEGLEGTEDLINRVLTNPQLSTLKERFLTELHRRWKC